MTIFNLTDVSWGFQAVRSSHCVNGDCLVASVGPGRCVMVWDSKDPLVVQVWEPKAWGRLLKAIKGGYRYVGVVDCGALVYLAPVGHDELRLPFTSDDWAAFKLGVKAGEFDYDKLCSPASRAGNSDAGRTAATGAVEPGTVPAPVAAALEPLANAAALVEVDALADDPGLRLGPATGAGEASAASSRPPPVVAGMNAAGYAAMNVPAGRPDGDASTVDGANLAVAGRPGSQASEFDVDELADFIAEARRNGAYAETWTLARWLLGQGYRRNPALMEAEAAWKRLAAPLVPLDTSHAAVDMGWASPDGLVNEAGEVGPGTEHPSSGPTEPADDCGNTCFVHKGLAEQAERERARA